MMLDREERKKVESELSTDAVHPHDDGCPGVSIYLFSSKNISTNLCACNRHSAHRLDSFIEACVEFYYNLDRYDQNRLLNNRFYFDQRECDHALTILERLSEI